MILFYYEMTHRISIDVDCSIAMQCPEQLLMPVVLLVILDLWFYPDARRDAFVSHFKLERNDCWLNESPVTMHSLAQ